MLEREVDLTVTVCIHNPCIEILTFAIMLQAIEQEKAEKFRKLQDASRSAQALAEQMVNGNYAKLIS